jgi:TctA family transporter
MQAWSPLLIIIIALIICIVATVCIVAVFRKSSKKNINWEYYVFSFSGMVGFILTIGTIYDAIVERWYLFFPGLLLLGIAFLMYKTMEDMPPR